MLRRTVLAARPVALVGLRIAPVAIAQDKAADYPSKPVTILVPYAAGGTSDMFARLLADELGKALGQRFLVENKPGASGNIGAAQLAKATPDGYTLGIGTVATHAINPLIFKNLPFDAANAFAPVSLVATLPNVLVVNPGIEARSVPELIELLKAKPGELTFASSGVGTSQHVSGELFMARTGTRMTHVPYKGSGQLIMDVVAGHVDLSFDNIPLAAQQAKAGGVRALAVTSLERSPLLPEVPPVAEFIPGFEATSWQALFAPAGTPPEIVGKVSGEVQRVMRLPHIQERLVSIGAMPVGNTPEEFARYIGAETRKWAEVVEAARISVEQ